MTSIETLDELLRQGGQTQAVRADLILQRRRLYEALHPKAIAHGGARRGWKTKRYQSPSFVADTAASLNISESTVRRLLRQAEAK